MKVAILSDIHGNQLALEAVLKDLEYFQPVDHILVPGDFFAFGSSPAEVFDILKTLPNASFLMGNTDRYLLQRTYPTGQAESGWQASLLQSFQWTAEQLPPEAFDFLRALPGNQTLQMDQWQLLIVHGSPRSDEEGLTVETDEEDFANMAIDPDVDLLICGHTHKPMDRTINNIRVLNVGSVGLPFDGVVAACYTLLLPSRIPGTYQVVFRRVAYDVDAAAMKFYQRNCPGAQTSAYNLRTARPMGDDLIYTRQMRCIDNTPSAPLDPSIQMGSALGSRSEMLTISK